MRAREYLKEMDTKEKIDYIWYYYKFHIIAVIALMILIGIFVHDSINNKNYVFNFTIIGNSINSDIQNSMQEEATKLLLGKTDGKDQVLFDFILASANSNGDQELDPAMQQKFSVKVAVGDINAVAIDKKLFEQLAAQGGLLKLTDLNGLDTGNAGFVKAKNDTGAEDNYGIDISSNKRLKEMGYDTQNKVLCITVKTKDMNMTVKFINWLLK